MGLACCRLPATVPPPRPLSGPQLFARHCAACHGVRGEGVSGAVAMAGPSLQAEHNPGWIMAAEVIGPAHMPSFLSVLSSRQMRAIATYVAGTLAVIPPLAGDRARGGRLFRAYCAPCHGTAVRGGALVFAGVNAPPLTGVSRPLLQGAIRMGPGPMPAFPAAVLSDRDLASIADSVLTVQHPARPGGAAMGWFGPAPEALAAWAGASLLLVFAVWAEKGGKG